MVVAGEIRAPLCGVDISHHNVPFSRWYGDFQIHKATEGKTFVDPDYGNWTEERKNIVGSLNGAYHFMSAYSDPKLQAEHFINEVMIAGLDVVPILDLESGALEKAIAGSEDALKWLDIVANETGIKPWIYCNTYGVSKLKDKKYSDYPLWIASYNKKYPKYDSVWLDRYGLEKGWLCWQYASVPWDCDIFNGTVEDWKSYEWKL